MKRRPTLLDYVVNNVPVNEDDSKLRQSLVINPSETKEQAEDTNTHIENKEN